MILPDGTPVEDILAHNRELQAELVALKSSYRNFVFQVQSQWRNYSAEQKRDAIAVARAKVVGKP